MSVWLLPENIADMLPREARCIEQLRAKFLNLVTSHGFEIVKPPMIEYVDSLLTGTGSDLDLRTFKIVDQVSGRTLAFRADMTPQVARIDAHILNRTGITRLCYAGSLLHARPLHPMASRQPYVAGLEVFGSRSRQSDLEVIRLGIEALYAFGLTDLHLDIGHVGIVRCILKNDPGCNEVIETILSALSHKDPTAIDGIADKIKPKTASDLKKLMRFFGGMDVLDEIQREFSEYQELVEIIDEVKWVAKRCSVDHISFDFADVHGYQYLTGITFSVAIPTRYQAVMRGGRYDSIGAKFGRERPAVGLTLYLREISAVMPTRRPYAVAAPSNVDDLSLSAKIDELRGEGRIVVQLLPEDDLQSLEEAFRLDEELVCQDGNWIIKRRYFKKEMKDV